MKFHHRATQSEALLAVTIDNYKVIYSTFNLPTKHTRLKSADWLFCSQQTIRIADVRRVNFEYIHGLTNGQARDKQHINTEVDRDQKGQLPRVPAREGPGSPLYKI